MHQGAHNANCKCRLSPIQRLLSELGHVKLRSTSRAWSAALIRVGAATGSKAAAPRGQGTRRERDLPPFMAPLEHRPQGNGHALKL
jgi:hypothetical protein